MKLLLDFLPILLFFVTFKYAEGHKDWAAALATEHLGFLVSGGKVGPGEAPVLLATVVVVAASLAQVAWLKLRGRKVDLMLWVSLALVVVLGGLTLWFHSETFIKWKPTGLYWAMGLAFLVSQLVYGRSLLKVMTGDQLSLPDPVWRRLSWAWAAFFAGMGVLNLWVAYNFSTDTWVNFKLFGGLGLVLVFSLAQGAYISRHLPPEDTPGGCVHAPHRRPAMSRDSRDRREAAMPALPSTPAVTQQQIEAALHAALGPLDSLAVVNESHLHAGHAGAAEGSHWRVRIAGAALAGQRRVAQHRLVYDALRPLIEQGIHALAIEVSAPNAAKAP